MASRRAQVLGLVRRQGVIRPKDLNKQGISTKYLSLVHAEGSVHRIARGVYALADAEASEHHSLVEASTQVPKGIICLLSALRFHELTTQSPFEVWMAIEEKAWKPAVVYPPIRFVRFSGEAWRYGAGEHRIGNFPIRVYSPAKTVADCFKYRNKIGLEVAIEALRDVWGQKRATMDELWRAAAVCRVQNVMKPFIESLA